MKPIVKWAGGKRRLLHELVARVPARLERYVEPFAGGAALFFALAEQRSAGLRDFSGARLSDTNDELMTCYRAVQRNVEDVISALRGFRNEPELFYAVRAQSTSGMSDVERAARVLFLNRTCFNGLWRTNASGMFNAAFGHRSNPRILDEAGLRLASEALRGVELLTTDFFSAVDDLLVGDFVYFDPPYHPLSRTSRFTQYGPGGFGKVDQERLRASFEHLRNRGVHAMLSNSDTPYTRDLYSGFSQHIVMAPRTINGTGSRRGKVSEILVTTW